MKNNKNIKNIFIILFNVIVIINVILAFYIVIEDVLNGGNLFIDLIKILIAIYVLVISSNSIIKVLKKMMTNKKRDYQLR